MGDGIARIMFAEEIEGRRTWERYSRNWEGMMDYLVITSETVKRRRREGATLSSSGRMASSRVGHFELRNYILVVKRYRFGEVPTNPCCHHEPQCRELFHLYVE